MMGIWLVTYHSKKGQSSLVTSNSKKGQSNCKRTIECTAKEIKGILSVECERQGG